MIKTESILHFVWQYFLFETSNLSTTNNEPIYLINQGLSNNDAGPDFLNAQLKIGNTEWHGNVEIHIRSSDWTKHRHQTDPKYDNVMLHVVYEHDTEVFNSKGNRLPTLELKTRIQRRTIDNYEQLFDEKLQIPCGQKATAVDDFTWTMWKERLFVERLAAKTVLVDELLKTYQNDWESVMYHFLLRSLGSPHNAQPMQQLAKRLPLRQLQLHRQSLDALEAMLFGTAGFLDFKEEKDDDKNETLDGYTKHLKNEFSFYKNKFQLQPFDQSIWHFLRMRPAGFPTIRIAQIAQFLHQTPNLLSAFIECETLADIRKLLNIETSEYWQNHYQVNKEAKTKRRKKLGATTIDKIVINALAPVLFIYAKRHEKHELSDRIIRFLEKMKAEDNRIIRSWDALNIVAGNAAESQALLQLKKEYCDQKRCLSCQIGMRLMRQD